MDGRAEAQEGLPRTVMPSQEGMAGLMESQQASGCVRDDELSVFSISNGAEEEHRLLPPGSGHWRC